MLILCYKVGEILVLYLLSSYYPNLNRQHCDIVFEAIQTYFLSISRVEYELAVVLIKPYPDMVILVCQFQNAYPGILVLPKSLY